MSEVSAFWQPVLDAHAKQVERGEHDQSCEWRPAGFYLCHCSKRRREHAGYTEPPDALIYQPPLCPRCGNEVDHGDGDHFTCEHCCVGWDQTGDQAHFIDDYGGDLAADLATWEARHSSQAVAHA